MILEWFCHDIPWVSILSVVPMYPGDLAILTEPERTEVRSSAGRLREPRPTCVSVQRNFLHAHDLLFFMLCMNTHILTLTHVYMYPRLGFLGSLQRDISLSLPSSLKFFIASSSLHFSGLFGTSIMQFHLWPWISQFFSALAFDCSFYPMWLLSLFLIRDPCGESTYFRCWSHLSPDFGIRNTNPSPGGFSSFVISFKLDGHSMVSTIFSTCCLLRCFTRKYKKVVMHFSCKKYTQLSYNSAPGGISVSISLFWLLLMLVPYSFLLSWLCQWKITVHAYWGPTA